MWKIAVGFALFAALALFVLSKGGDIDMGGEKHGDAIQTEASSDSTVAPAATPTASSSEAPASAPK